MNQTKQLLKVFLCHTHSDKEAVRDLYRHLTRDGVDAWLDEENILAGQTWRDVIEDNVRTSDVILVCLSSRSVSKEGFVQKEIKIALDVADEKPEDTIFIIPARLDDCVVPRRLKDLHWVDLFDKTGYPRLRRALEARASQLGRVPVKLPKTAPVADIDDKSAETTAPSSPLTQISIARSFPAPGSRPEGITWDGMALWVSDDSGVIFKVDPSGDVLDSIQSPDVTPQGLTWNGSSLWVYTSNRSVIYQVEIDAGKARPVTSFRSPAEVVGGGITQDMAWDGKHLWYANQFKVYKLDTLGKILSSFTFPKNVSGLGWDGSNLWVAYNHFPEKASLTRIGDNTRVLKTLISPVFEINGLAWANGHFWTLGSNSVGAKPMIYEFNMPAK